MTMGATPKFSFLARHESLGAGVGRCRRSEGSLKHFEDFLGDGNYGVTLFVDLPRDGRYGSSPNDRWKPGGSLEEI